MFCKTYFSESRWDVLVGPILSCTQPLHDSQRNQLYFGARQSISCQGLAGCLPSWGSKAHLIHSNRGREERGAIPTSTDWVQPESVRLGCIAKVLFLANGISSFRSCQGVWMLAFGNICTWLRGRTSAQMPSLAQSVPRGRGARLHQSPMIQE